MDYYKLLVGMHVGKDEEGNRGHVYRAGTADCLVPSDVDLVVLLGSEKFSYTRRPMRRMRQQPAAPSKPPTTDAAHPPMRLPTPPQPAIHSPISPLLSPSTRHPKMTEREKQSEQRMREMAGEERFEEGMDQHEAFAEDEGEDGLQPGEGGDMSDFEEDEFEEVTPQERQQERMQQPQPPRSPQVTPPSKPGTRNPRTSKPVPPKPTAVPAPPKPQPQQSESKEESSKESKDKDSKDSK